jgi:hypothetical protein
MIQLFQAQPLWDKKGTGNRQERCRIFFGKDNKDGKRTKEVPGTNGDLLRAVQAQLPQGLLLFLFPEGEWVGPPEPTDVVAEVQLLAAQLPVLAALLADDQRLAGGVRVRIRLP